MSILAFRGKHGSTRGVGTAPGMTYFPKIEIKLCLRHADLYGTPMILNLMPQIIRHGIVGISGKTAEEIGEMNIPGKVCNHSIQGRTKGPAPTAHWVVNIINACCHGLPEYLYSKKNFMMYLYDYSESLYQAIVAN